MRNYQEDNIPPWKKEVLMRRDGLSKAIENDTECLLSLDDNMSSPTHSINRKKQTRFKIGSSSSLISSVKSFFLDKGHDEMHTKITQMSKGTKDTKGILFYV